MKVVTVVDANVFIDNLGGSHKKLFDYLEEHPYLGLTTDKILESVEKYVLERHVRRETTRVHYRDSMERIKFLPSFIEVHNFNYNDIQNELPKVTSFFSDIVDRNAPVNIGAVSLKYRRLLKDIYKKEGSLSSEEEHKLSQKAFFEMTEDEDMSILASTNSLPAEHKFIATADRHFIDTFISKAIEDKFGVKCRHPDKILPEIKEYEHLFKEKVIL